MKASGRLIEKLDILDNMHPNDLEVLKESFDMMRATDGNLCATYSPDHRLYDHAYKIAKTYSLGTCVFADQTYSIRLNSNGIKLAKLYELYEEIIF
jgi:hypothetical protein